MKAGATNSWSSQLALNGALKSEFFFLSGKSSDPSRHFSIRRRVMGFNQKKLLGTLLLALAQFASATTWYVNGATGKDTNNCLSPTSACKTIGHAISLASSGDSITVAAATYKENLTIGISLSVIGAGARTTIIDGGGVKRVVSISSGNVTLAGLTIRHGFAPYGYGGVGAGIF